MIREFDISFIKYDPTLGKVLGRGGALFINALQFLLQNHSLGKHYADKRWVYNTAEQWAHSLKYSTRQVERIIAQLRKKEIILVKKLSSFKGNATNYYAINEEKLNEILQVNDSGSLKSSPTCLSKIKKDNKEENGPPDILSSPLRQKGGNITKKTTQRINNKSEKPKQILFSDSIFEEGIQKHQAKKPIFIKNTTAQEMLFIWNRIFNFAPTSMSKQIAPLLVAAYKQKFESNMKKWETYCHTIATSTYLTGNQFNLSLFWALKYSIIERIKNREFGVKEIHHCSFTKAEALHHIQILPEPDKCKEIRIKLLQLYGEKVYKSWLYDLELTLINGKVCFKAKNTFIKNYIENHYGKIFEKA